MTGAALSGSSAGRLGAICTEDSVLPDLGLIYPFTAFALSPLEGGEAEVVGGSLGANISDPLPQHCGHGGREGLSTAWGCSSPSPAPTVGMEVGAHRMELVQLWTYTSLKQSWVSLLTLTCEQLLCQGLSVSSPCRGSHRNVTRSGRTVRRPRCSLTQCRWDWVGRAKAGRVRNSLQRGWQALPASERLGTPISS